MPILALMLVSYSHCNTVLPKDTHHLFPMYPKGRVSRTPGDRRDGIDVSRSCVSLSDTLSYHCVCVSVCGGGADGRPTFALDWR